MVFQSWDTANKPTELSDYSVCTTWGAKDKKLYLLHVCRKRLGYPELKRAVRDQAESFSPKTILIEDKASGTQLIQELIYEGMHSIKKYEPTMDKVDADAFWLSARLRTALSIYRIRQHGWRNSLHELTIFPKGKNDDQADSTSQALNWFKNSASDGVYGLLEYAKQESKTQSCSGEPAIPESRPCSGCDGVMRQRIPGGLRCMQCCRRSNCFANSNNILDCWPGL